MTTPRKYTELTDADQTQMRTERIKALEAEHYANTLALTGSLAVLQAAEDASASKTTDEDRAQHDEVLASARANVNGFQNNVATLDATLDALLA